MSESLGLGSAGFVERHGYSDEQAHAAGEVVARISDERRGGASLRETESSDGNE